MILARLVVWQRLVLWHGSDSELWSGNNSCGMAVIEGKL